MRRTLWAWATRSVRRFAKRNNERGKRADVILLDLNQAHAMPLYDIYAQLLYTLGRDNVSTVIINGKIVMRDHQLLTINESDLKGQLLELGDQINTELQEMPVV